MPHDPPTHRFEHRIPAGDDRPRLVCADCGFVDYRNPRIVVGSVATWGAAGDGVAGDGAAGDGAGLGGERILLCRRAIEPRRGFWTLPAGYLELHESAERGAHREAWEEARAMLAIEQLLAVYTIERLSQVQLIYRARLLSPAVSAGPESLEVGLFAWAAIPWPELAFPSVRWALQHHREAPASGGFAPFANPPGADAALPGPKAEAGL